MTDTLTTPRTLANCGCGISAKGELMTKFCTENHKLITKRQAEQIEDHWIDIRAKDSIGAYLKAKFQVFRELFG